MKFFTVSISVYVSLTVHSTSFADSSSFFESPPLTKREKCEIDRSWASDNRIKLSLPQCRTVQLFVPMKQLDRNDKLTTQELKLSPKNDEGWPLPELLIKTEQTRNHLNVSQFSLNNLDYNLSEYVPLEKHGYRQIAVGKINDILVLQFRDESITQLFFMPQQCGDDEVEYGVKQVFSWYPPMQGDSYYKTFFTTPFCN